jgi:hypothetical protein
MVMRTRCQLAVDERQRPRHAQVDEQARVLVGSHQRQPQVFATPGHFADRPAGKFFDCHSERMAQGLAEPGRTDPCAANPGDESESGDFHFGHFGHAGIMVVAALVSLAPPRHAAAMAGRCPIHRQQYAVS